MNLKKIMNKKITTVLFAILIVSTLAQTNAILNIFSEMRSEATFQDTNNQVENFLHTRKHQVAAVDSSPWIPEDPGPTEGYIVIYHVEFVANYCLIYLYGFTSDFIPLGVGGPIHGVSDQYGNCWYGFIDDSGDTVGTVSLPTTGEMDSIKASSSTIEAQFKLMILGYLKEDNITNKLDTKTENALKAFQKSNGISETGTYGPQTKAAIDKILSQAKQTDVKGKMLMIKR